MDINTTNCVYRSTLAIIDKNQEARLAGFLKSCSLFCVCNASHLPDYGDFYLTGILHIAFNFL
jgi:hypothetical protein